MYKQRKCGINRLSDDRLWRTREQINNTHTCRYILGMVYDETSDECSAIPCSLIKSPNFIVKDKSETLSSNM